MINRLRSLYLKYKRLARRRWEKMRQNECDTLNLWTIILVILLIVYIIVEILCLIAR